MTLFTSLKLVRLKRLKASKMSSSASGLSRFEADSPSHSQISGEEPRPDARVASYCERAVVVDGVEVDVKSRPDVEGEAAARRDDRRDVKIGGACHDPP